MFAKTSTTNFCFRTASSQSLSQSVGTKERLTFQKNEDGSIDLGMRVNNKEVVLHWGEKDDEPTISNNTVGVINSSMADSFDEQQSRSGYTPSITKMSVTGSENKISESEHKSILSGLEDEEDGGRNQFNSENNFVVNPLETKIKIKKDNNRSHLV